MPARLPVDLQGGFGPGGSGISVEPPNITWPGMPPPGYMGGGELGSSGLGSPSSIDVYGGTPGFVPPVGIPNVWYSPTLFPYGTPFPVPPPPLPNVPPPPGGASPPAGTVSGTGQPVNWGPGVGTGQVSLTPNAPFS